MVRTTRSQARTAAQSSATPALSTADESLQRGSEARSGDDEVQASSSKSAAPARKRARVAGASKSATAAQSSKAGSKKGKSRRRDLSLLPEMPFDVLHETLMHLEPKDLLHMARANKDFRRALVHPSMSGLWMAKRKEIGAPDPPSTVSEAKWLSFLIGRFCYSCGTSGALAEWQLLKRLCVACRKRHYVAGTKFSKKFPDVDAGILEYISYTNYGAWANGVPSNGKFYWDDDILQMDEQLTILQANIDSKHPGAKQALQVFKEERAEYVHQMQLVASQCRKWLSDVELQNRQDSQSVKAERIAAVRQRLLDMGYEEDDTLIIQSRRNLRSLCGHSNITDRVWAKLLPKIEPTVIQHRDYRLFAIKFALMQRRMAILTERYDLWKASLTVPTAELYAYPQDYDLWHLPVVTALLEADKTVAVTVKDFQPIIDDFPNIVITFISERKAALRALVSTASKVSDSTQDVLDLATSMFSCQPWWSNHHVTHQVTNSVLAGWKMAEHHHFSQEYNGTSIKQRTPYEIKPEIVEVAKSLVKLCGLDPDVTTIDKMDELDERFVCTHCQAMPNMPPLLEVFTWKAAVNHYHKIHLRWGYDADRKTFASTAFQLLKQEDQRREAKEKEQLQLSVYQGRAWYCNYCTRFKYWESTTLDNVRQHVKDEHQVDEPCVPSDYFFNEGFRADLEKPVKIEELAEGAR